MSSPKTRPSNTCSRARIHARVAAQRVDLAVVAEEAERLRELPRRERVGAEALVHHRERAHHRLVVEVAVEAGELLGEEQALVDDRARREARDVEAIRARSCRSRGPCAPPTCGSRTACARTSSDRGRPTPMSTCLMTGALCRAIGPSALSSTGTSRQPSSRCPDAEDLVLEDLLAATALVRVARQKHAAAAVLAAAPGSRMPSALALLLEELVRELHQDAGAVARQRVAAAGAAMHEVQEDLHALADDLVRGVRLGCSRRSRRRRRRARVRVVQA